MRPGGPETGAQCGSRSISAPVHQRIVVGVVGDGRTIAQDIFEADYARWDEPGGTYAAPDATFTHTTTFERAHALSDVLGAVLDAGMIIELFHEQSFTNAPWPWTVRGDDGFFRLPEGWPKYPLTYSLRARRPAT